MKIEKRWFKLFHKDDEAMSRASMMLEESALSSMLDIDMSQKLKVLWFLILLKFLEIVSF